MTPRPSSGSRTPKSTRSFWKQRNLFIANRMGALQETGRLDKATVEPEGVSWCPRGKSLFVADDDKNAIFRSARGTDWVAASPIRTASISIGRSAISSLSAASSTSCSKRRWLGVREDDRHALLPDGSERLSWLLRPRVPLQAPTDRGSTSPTGGSTTTAGCIRSSSWTSPRRYAWPGLDPASSQCSSLSLQ